MKKFNLESVVVVVGLSSMALAMGCQPSEPESGDHLSACETSHEFKLAADGLADVIRYSKQKVAQEGKVSRKAYWEALDAANDKYRMQASLAFKHDYYIHVDCKYDGLLGPSLRWDCEKMHDLRKDLTFDYKPITAALEYGMWAGTHLAETVFTKTEEVCVPGPQYQDVPGGGKQLVDSNCAIKRSQEVHTPGYEQAIELTANFQAVYLGMYLGEMENYTAVQIDELSQKLDKLRSNGVATYLAAQCAPHEAFAKRDSNAKKARRSAPANAAI